MENKLPEGWEWKKLGDITTNYDGKRVPLKKEERKDVQGIYPYYGASGIIDYVNDYLFDGEYLLVGEDGANLIARSTPIAFKATSKFWANNHAHILKTSEDVSLSYLMYYINNIDLKKYITGTAQPKLTQQSMNRIVVPVPPFETQQKIVSILEKAEETKKLRAQADELTQKLLQNVFLEMLGDPMKNPKGWNVRKLGEIITDSMNGLYLPKEKYASHDGIKMVHMSDAFYGLVELGNLKKVLATKKETDKYGLTKNDLLIARRSLNFEGAAKACRISELNEPLIFESSLIKVSPDLKLVTTIYLYYYLNNELVRKTYIYKHITKSTISGINQNSLKNVSVILPPIEVQNKFSDFVEQAEKTILNQQRSSLEINTLFDAIMQKAFTGELVS